MNHDLLQVRDVKVHFPAHEHSLFKHAAGVIKAVDGVSLSVCPGETLGLVGESGCGKTTLARAVVRLTPLTGGKILFDGKDLGAISPGALRALRPQIQMIFQDPYASLNPRMTVFDTIAEPLWVHGLAGRRDLAARVAELMEQVGLAARFMKKYPHEFSGGQRQRIAIARTLALNPRLILADEPVSALDVSVQAQILNLLRELRERFRLTLVLISHDLGVVRHLSNRIAVMYLGKIVEIGEAETVFSSPMHPYTQALLSAIPLPDPDYERARRKIALQGDAPLPVDPPGGCPFHPRCPIAGPECAATVPEFASKNNDHQAACLKIEGTPRT